MAADPNVIDQAVSRTLRDSLERIQRTSDELHQAVNDLVSACASSRPSNALPAMIRAQTSAASLSAVLEVLSRFVAVALRPPMEFPAPPAPLREEPPIPAASSWSSTECPPSAAISETPVTFETSAPAQMVPEPVAPAPLEPQLFVPEPLAPQPMSIDVPLNEPSVAPEPPAEAPIPPVELPFEMQETQVPVHERPVEEPPPPIEHAPAAGESAFDVNLLSGDLQELHRRANRVAKVSMQDIKMLRPEDVRVGRENKDLCFRLRDDIEKAHKEYERRFQPILSHPVDYFYDWMVQILAGGDSRALGEYPYSSTVLHR